MQKRIVLLYVACAYLFFQSVTPAISQSARVRVFSTGEDRIAFTNPLNRRANCAIYTKIRFNFGGYLHTSRWPELNGALVIPNETGMLEVEPQQTIVQAYKSNILAMYRHAEPYEIVNGHIDDDRIWAQCRIIR